MSEVVQLAIIAGAALLTRVASIRLTDRLVRRAVERAAHSTDDHDGRRAQRVATVTRLTTRVVNVLVWGVAGVTALSVFGINVAPILASAGVVGVAVGFGAQTLVKDYLAGLFMIIEDQCSVGDEVELATATTAAQGVVEEVGLRVTRLRGDDGVVWYVRNGEVQRVANKSKGTA